jgi:glucosamine kinase
MQSKLVPYTLIVDCGSTKSNWAFMSREETLYLQARGFNPLNENLEYRQEVLKDWKAKLSHYSPNQIFYYGAGCINSTTNQIVKDLLHDIFPNTKNISVKSDLNLVLEADPSQGPKIVGILGTGSNTCVVENDSVIDQIPSLGFLYGDFGSGYVLGKSIIHAVFNRTCPEILRTKVLADQALLAFRKFLFEHPDPKSFVAGLVVHLNSCIEEKSVQELIDRHFEDFYKQLIVPYQQKLPIILYGSIAHYFEKHIKETGLKFGFPTVSCVKDPLESWIKNRL